MMDDLADLVENPRETLEIELKQWLDLDDHKARASVARHIAAISNHGGGYLIFGFEDDYSVDENRPTSFVNYNRDGISSIVRKYLSPSLHCDVETVAATNGDKFVVVRVPGHGPTPITSLRGGPSDAKGRPQGIRSNTVYIRSVGPSSEPITTGDWSGLIRRCVMNDRNLLLRQLTQLFGPQVPIGISTSKRLRDWANTVEQRFRSVLEGTPEFVWPVPLGENYYQLSYLISHGDEDKTIAGLRDLLNEANNEVRDTVWTGWSMFYPFSPKEIAPSVFPEHEDGTGGDLLETNLISLDQDHSTTMPDFWRVSPDGRASLIRGFREDVRLNKEYSWVSPETIVRETAELVCHARAYASRFPLSTTVSFRCTWVGLEGRVIDDFDSSIHWRRGQVCKANTRTKEGEWSVVQLNTSWEEIVWELSAPILSLFGFEASSAKFVESIAPRFRKL